MPKGQPIGGQARRPGRGMLPPLPGAPIEVTKEYVEQQEGTVSPPAHAATITEQQPVPAQQTAEPTAAVAVPPPAGEVATVDDAAPAVPEHPLAVDAHGFITAPRFAPPASDDQHERLAHYVRGVKVAEEVAKANHDRVEHLRVLSTAPHLIGIKDEELWKVAGYETFGDLTDAEFGFKKNYANKLIRSYPVALALESVATSSLKDAHLVALAPIHEAHGEDAVRQTWTEALRRGNTTVKGLLAAARFLGYGPPEQIAAVVTNSRPAAPKSTEPPGRAAAVIADLRSLAEQDRERARREAEELRTMLDELMQEITEPVTG